MYDRSLGQSFFRRARRVFETLVRRHRIAFADAADVGCGTGLFARYLAITWRVPVFAVDRSPEMLRVAARNCAGLPVQLLQQDLRDLRLPRRVSLITANFDVLNHLLNQRDLWRVIRRIHASLLPGGHFLFDLLTPRQELPYDACRVLRLPGLVQRIRWDAPRRLISVTVLLRRGVPGALLAESHIERAHCPCAVIRLLNAAGLQLIAMVDGGTLQPARSCTPRLVLLARKGG